MGERCFSPHSHGKHGGGSSTLVAGFGLQLVTKPRFFLPWEAQGPVLHSVPGSPSSPPSLVCQPLPISAPLPMTLSSLPFSRSVLPIFLVSTLPPSPPHQPTNQHLSPPLHFLARVGSLAVAASFFQPCRQHLMLRSYSSAPGASSKGGMAPQAPWIHLPRGQVVAAG